MTHWKSPYRICITGRDSKPAEAIKNAIKESPDWGCVVAKEAHDALLLTMNSGCSLVFLDEATDEDDLSTLEFCIGRYFVADRMPLPMVVLKLQEATANASDLLASPAGPMVRTGFIQPLKPPVVTNPVKATLQQLLVELKRNGTAWSEYSLVQLRTFASETENGEVTDAAVRKEVPEECWFFTQFHDHMNKKNFRDANRIAEKILSKYPDINFIKLACARISYGERNKGKARTILDSVLGQGHRHPAYLYLAFIASLEGRDYGYAASVLDWLNRGYAEAYATQVAKGLWYSRMGKREEATRQLFYCLQLHPHDVLVAEELIFNLSELRHSDLRKAVQQMAFDHLIATEKTRELFSLLFWEEVLEETA